MINIDLFKNKNILITGGTGFLGRHLVREILKYDPKAIRILSRDEVKHHKMQEEFNYDDRLRHLIGDVRDYERLKKACEEVDIVIHAAALKRLDILEYNVDESVKTNIIGTLNVANACRECNVEKAVFVSSDKACHPVNSYGACKFVGERIFSESNFNKGNRRTIFTCVRYGNVLESTGSVIPFFESKIKRGEEIPLTDARMTRFIITPGEAVQLIFKALEYGVGGEVFIPRLPAFKITNLIEILKEKHKANNKIKVIGIRPGEKIHEIMINDAEAPRTLSFKDVFVVTSCIETDSSGKIAEYIKFGKSLAEKDMCEYSSRDSVLNKDELKELFLEYDMI